MSKDQAGPPSFTRPPVFPAAEQVTGRKRQVMFHVHAPRDEVHGLVQQLRASFRDAGLHYWVMPVIEAGPIS